MRDVRPYVLPDGTEIPGCWRGGRFIASAYGWRKLTAWAANAVTWCEHPSGEIHRGTEWHHIYGRGGGKRDDRIEIDWKPNLRWVCRWHHKRTKILRRG